MCASNFLGWHWNSHFNAPEMQKKLTNAPPNVQLRTGVVWCAWLTFEHGFLSDLRTMSLRERQTKLVRIYINITHITNKTQFVHGRGEILCLPSYLTMMQSLSDSLCLSLSLSDSLCLSLSLSFSDSLPSYDWLLTKNWFLVFTVPPTWLGVAAHAMRIRE